MLKRKWFKWYRQLLHIGGTYTYIDIGKPNDYPRQHHYRIEISLFGAFFGFDVAWIAGVHPDFDSLE